MRVLSVCLVCALALGMFCGHIYWTQIIALVSATVIHICSSDKVCSLQQFFLPFWLLLVSLVYFYFLILFIYLIFPSSLCYWLFGSVRFDSICMFHCKTSTEAAARCMPVQNRKERNENLETFTSFNHDNHETDSANSAKVDGRKSTSNRNTTRLWTDQ